MAVAKVGSRIDKIVLPVPLRRDVLSWVRAACVALEGLHGPVEGSLTWAGRVNHTSREV
jgi:hypothetical protein